MPNINNVKHKNKPALIRLIIDYFLSHKVALIISFLCTFLVALGNIVAPLVLQNVVKILTEAGLKSGSITNAFELYWDEILNLIIVLISCYFISICAAFTFAQINAITAQKYLDELRRKIFSHMEDLPIRFFDTHDKGDIMSVYTNDVDTIREFIVSSVPEILMCSVTFLAALVIMSISSIWLLFIVIIGAIFMFLNARHIGGNSSKNFIKQQVYIGKQEGFIEEMMNGLKVIKSFNHESESIQKYNGILDELQSVSTRAHGYANILMPIIGNIGNLMYIIVAVVGTLLCLYNVPNLSFTANSEGSLYYGIEVATWVGIIVSFLPMVRQFTNSVAQMSNQINTIALATGGAKRIYQILDEEQEVDDGYVKLCRAKYDENGNIVEVNNRKEQTIWAWKHPHKADGTVTYTLLEGDIRMFDVDFGYVPNQIVLHNITLYAYPGQKVAFVGATGAGKTTITNLLNRFYDIADGKIRYDGININKISKKDLRRSLGMVLQDTNLFSGTIMDNIRYGKLDASDEECIAAAKLANAHGFIERLPEGYQTYLTNDGSNLSQGQRQLLSIARAAVNDAPVMVLDEATSSIDTRTEAIVTKGMDNLMKGRTVFVIAHRLSTIQNSDVIMVLDHGRIIERGNHDDLIAQGGVYYQLYTGAFELE